MTSALARPVTLIARHATLLPLPPEHRDALAEAVYDGELWKLWYTTVPTADQLTAEIRQRLDLQWHLERPRG